MQLVTFMSQVDRCIGSALQIYDLKLVIVYQLTSIHTSVDTKLPLSTPALYIL